MMLRALKITFDFPYLEIFSSESNFLYIFSKSIKAKAYLGIIFHVTWEVET